MGSERNNDKRTVQLVYWVIGVVAITGVIFMFWPQEEALTKLRGNLRLSSDAKGIVNSYVQWAEGASESRMDLNHDFEANGLTKMADALRVLSTSVSQKVSQDSEPGIDIIKEVAGFIVKDPKSLEHADMVKKAFTASKQVLASVQTNFFPNLNDEIEFLGQKVSAIKADKLMLEQKAEIIEIYQQVAVILKKMINDENTSVTLIKNFKRVFNSDWVRAQSENMRYTSYAHLLIRTFAHMLAFPH